MPEFETLPIGLPPEEAIAWFRARVPLTKAKWLALEERARRKAFTVAGVAQLDLVTEVYQALDKAIAEGTTFEEFQAAVGEKLAKAWGGAGSHRLDTIFRTNVQMAYQAGRWRQMTEPAILKTRPFWMYDAVIDSATSTPCRERDGTVRPATDPWWETNYPPLHFRCRSGVRTLTRQQAEARGITEKLPDEPPPEGFGFAPVEHWGRAWASGAIHDARVPRWEHAFQGAPPGPADYGRPARIPTAPLPAPLLPTIKEAGPEGFRKEVARSWGALTVDVADPTGTRVILSEVLIGHLKGDGRERFVSSLPGLVEAPFEIWLMPMREVRTGRIVFRRRYIKLYQDEQERPILLVAEMHKGAWTGWTLIEAAKPDYLNRQRQGFLLWPKA